MIPKLVRYGVAAAALSVPSAPVRAAAPPDTARAGALSLDWRYDGPALALGGLGAAWTNDRMAHLPPADPAALRRGDLNPFDRPVAGWYSPAAARASDVLVALVAAAPVLEAGREARTAGDFAWGRLIPEGLIYGEGLLIATDLSLGMRSLRIHPRPLVYAGDAPMSVRRDPDAAGSFWSNHASTAFYAATFGAYVYGRKHPGAARSTLAWIWGGGLTAAATVAALRVAAGKHFPSDVLAGAAAGSLFGFATPWLHYRGDAALGLGLGPDGRPRTTFAFAF